MSVSLSSLGLYAPAGLECAKGGQHAVNEASVQRVVSHGGGQVFCSKCKQSLVLKPLDESGAPA